MEIVQLNSNAKLSEHFTLGELTKSGSHPEVYNIPSHEAIANLTNLTKWLEVLRERAASPDPSKGRGVPIIINSGYRSPQLNRKIYAAILINYAKESQQDFDELLIEKNRYGAIWLHFAVRPRDNRHKVNFLNA